MASISEYDPSGTTIALSVVIGITTLFISGSMVYHADDPSDLYYSFQLFLGRNFPWSWLWCILVYVGILSFFYPLLREQVYIDNKIDEALYPSPELQREQLKRIFKDQRMASLEPMAVFIPSTILFVLLLISGSMAYLITSSYLDAGCSLTVTLCLKPSLSGTIGYLGSLVYFLSFPLFMGSLVSAVAFISPLWMTGLASLTTRHPAEGRVSKTLKLKSLDNDIERDLARILSDYHSEDAQQVQRLLTEMSPLRRWRWATKAKKHAREAERLGRIARTRTDELRADTDLMHDVHSLERTRRNRE